MMAKKNLANIATSVFLIMALMVTGIAVKRTVDMRRKAAETGTKLYFSPDISTIAPGETKEVKFFIETGVGESLAGASAKICYSSNLKINNFATDVYRPKVDPYLAEMTQGDSESAGSTLPDGTKCVTVAGTTKMKGLSELKYGVIELFDINFTAVSKGEAKIFFAKEPLKTYYTPKSPMGEAGVIGQYGEAVITVADKVAGEQAKVSLDPTSISNKIDGTSEVVVKIDSTLKLDAVNIKLCYGKELKIVTPKTDVTIAGTDSAGLAAVDTVMIKENADGSTCANIFSLAEAKASVVLPSGAFDLFKVKFTGMSAGKGEIKLDKVTSYLSSPRDDNSSKVIYGIVNGTVAYNVLSGDVTETPKPVATETPVPVATETPVPVATSTPKPGVTLTPTPTEAPITGGVFMKFNMTFGDVMAEGKCAVANWTTVKVKLTDSQGNTAEDLVAKVTATETFVQDGVNPLRVFQVVAKFPKFEPKGNVFALIGGPVHMYEKYGKDSQDSEYKEYAGKLTGLTDSLTSTKEFDFTKYPLRAGDVTSQDKPGVPDNKMNALDYSYIKNAFEKRTDAEVVKKVDLNGDCVLMGPDAVIFTNNLNEKNGKEY